MLKLGPRWVGLCDTVLRWVNSMFRSSNTTTILDHLATDIFDHLNTRLVWYSDPHINFQYLQYPVFSISVTKIEISFFLAGCAPKQLTS